ncbi:MAG: hypothetical protein AAFY17_16955 [Cyanobacteria bacterium J06642_11]
MYLFYITSAADNDQHLATEARALLSGLAVVWTRSGLMERVFKAHAQVIDITELLGDIDAG